MHSDSWAPDPDTQEIIHNALQRKEELEAKLQELNESIDQLHAQRVKPQPVSEEAQDPQASDTSPTPAETQLENNQEPKSPTKSPTPVETLETLDQTQKKQELIEAIEKLQAQRAPRAKAAGRSSSEAVLKSAPLVRTVTRVRASQEMRGLFTEKSMEKLSHLPKRFAVVRDVYQKDVEERKLRAARVKEYSQFVRSQYSPQLRQRGRRVPQPELPQASVQVVTAKRHKFRLRPNRGVPTIVFDYLKELEKANKIQVVQPVFQTEEPQATLVEADSG